MNDNQKNPQNALLDGMLGLAVGDALGVPFEARTRAEMSVNPAVDMIGYGSHRQPEGTWSDDTSMALCIADSLCRRYDPDDIMKKFIEWKNHARYTATGVRFDIGRQTRRALTRYQDGLEASLCGDCTENGNGNGGLMRTLPISLYQIFLFGDDESETEAVLSGVHAVSSLTHAHQYGLVCCGIFTLILREMLYFRKENDTLTDICSRGFEKALRAYEAMGDEFKKAVEAPDLFVHPRILAGYEEGKIASWGYSVHTLHAALWCLMNTDSYSAAVLKAVNLGSDTDTTAAVTGALAGVYYGREAIPQGWIDKLKRRDFIEDICARLNKVMFPDTAKDVEIDNFTGEYAHMALKAGCTVTMDGVEYSNVYAAWLAQSVEPEERYQFSWLTAHQARRLAKQLPQRPGWEQEQEAALFDACMAKYSQNEALKEKLLATGDMPIVYDTTGAHDNELGRCSCKDCAQKEAKNLYGKILMRVRGELRKDTA